MADVALRTADASELATYLSHVYRQPIPTDHVAMRNASTSTMQWLWNFAPLPLEKLCVHRRETNVTVLCAAHARLPAKAVGISMMSPNLGLIRLEKFGVALPRAFVVLAGLRRWRCCPWARLGHAGMLRWFAPAKKRLWRSFASTMRLMCGAWTFSLQGLSGGAEVNR